jgi:hypothetical protein
MAAIALLLGCTSPAPEPASAEAVERAVTEAELQLKAADDASAAGATDEATQSPAKGATT